MRILGIDPGLGTTGYGVIETGQSREHKVKLLETGTIDSSSRDTLSVKLARIYKSLDSVIKEYSPEVMILEKLYSHYKHPVTATIMGHARGVICLAAAHNKVKLVEESVKRIRTALVGNGNASKEQTREIVAHILKFDPKKITLDASDALALALGFAHLERY